MRAGRSLRCIIFVLLFAGAAATALGQDVVLLETLGHQHDVEPAIAVNPTDPCDAVAVWFTRQSPRGGFYATTTDGWDTDVYVEEFVSLGGNLVDFSVAYDQFTGVFWACYLVGGEGIAYAKSGTSGGNLVFPSVNQLVFEAPAGTSGDKPWLAVGRRPSTFNQSNLYLAYTDANDIGIHFKRSVNESCSTPDLNGRCWEATQDLGADIGAFGNGAVPLVSPSAPEIIYVPYWVREVDDTGTPPHPGIDIIKSIDTGASFSDPLRVAQLADDLPGFRYLGNCVAGRAERIPKLPSIAARAKSPLTENVFLVWADLNEDSPGCDATCGTGTQADVDIYFARLKSSTMNGTLAVEPGFPKVMDLDPTVDYLCADQFFPWMTIDGHGTLHVVYFDNRHTPDALDITV